MRWMLVAMMCLAGCTEIQALWVKAEQGQAEPVQAEPVLEEVPARVEAKTETNKAEEVDPKSLPPQSPEKTKDFWAAIKPARKATHAKDYEAAIAGYTAALAVAPGHARALSGRGYAALLKGDLAAAETDLRAALAATTDVKLAAAVNFNMGLLCEKQGDLEGAKRYFQRSNELRPTKAAAAKLAESPVCVADIRVGDDTAEVYATWRALWDRYPDRRTNPPKDEAEAKQRVCGPCDGKVEIIEVWYQGEDSDDAGDSEATLLIQGFAGGLRVHALGDVYKGSACDDITDYNRVDTGAWLVVWVRDLSCSWVDQDCDPEEDDECEGMTREHTHEGMTYRVFNKGDLREALTVGSPEDDSKEQDPVVKLEISGDTATLTGGRCDRTVQLK